MSRDPLAVFDHLPPGDVTLYLLTKRGAWLHERSMCQTDILVDNGPGEKPGPCRRPIWGDGTVDGVRFDMCSKCWHMWAAFHSHYRLMQANPAAAVITDKGLDLLYVNRKMDGAQKDEGVDLNHSNAPDPVSPDAPELVTETRTWTMTVGDYADTEYGPMWAHLDNEHPVVVAYDPTSKMHCALAVEDGQSVELASWEACRQLRRYVAGHTVGGAG